MTCWLCGFKTTKLESNAEKITCNDGSCQICVAVATVDEEINQAVATLQRLFAKRYDLRSKQNRAHDLLHRLPDELKNHIFELLLPSQNEWGGTTKRESTIMPTYLASICRGWRDIAWSNPYLWSTIRVLLGKSTSGPSQFVQDWILRSRTLPLTFYIQVLDRSNRGLEQSREVLAQILDALSHCSNRLQSLSLDIPPAILHTFQHIEFQWHRLMRLRIMSSFRSHEQINQPLPFLNSTASPEKVEFGHVRFKSLQISWNRLSSAKVEWLELEDIAQLFQHALQMTDCHIVSFTYGPGSFSMPSITHHTLKTLSLHYAQDNDAGPTLLRSLTLPCLQEFHTDEMVLLVPLPALVHRSSCPLTRLTLFHDFGADMLTFDRLQPLPGVTDLLVEPIQGDQATMIGELLLKKYFPDLRHLTLRLEAFLALWHTGIVPSYLDLKRPRSEGPNEGRLHKLLVVDQGASGFEDMWNSDIVEELNALGISLRKDGFEFL